MSVLEDCFNIRSHYPYFFPYTIITTDNGSRILINLDEVRMVIEYREGGGFAFQLKGDGEAISCSQRDAEMIMNHLLSKQLKEPNRTIEIGTPGLKYTIPLKNISYLGESKVDSQETYFYKLKGVENAFYCTKKELIKIKEMLNKGE